MNTFYIKNNVVIFKLLKEFKKYNYIIKIITKSLFNLLYNLFIIKLTKLRYYLNNILIKN